MEKGATLDQGMTCIVYRHQFYPSHRPLLVVLFRLRASSLYSLKDSPSVMHEVLGSRKDYGREYLVAHGSFFVFARHSEPPVTVIPCMGHNLTSLLPTFCLRWSTTG